MSAWHGIGVTAHAQPHEIDYAANMTLVLAVPFAGGVYLAADKRTVDVSSDKNEIVSYHDHDTKIFQYTESCVFGIAGQPDAVTAALDPYPSGPMVAPAVFSVSDRLQRYYDRWYPPPIERPHSEIVVVERVEGSAAAIKMTSDDRFIPRRARRRLDALFLGSGWSAIKHLTRRLTDEDTLTDGQAFRVIVLLMWEAARQNPLLSQSIDVWRLGATGPAEQIPPDRVIDQQKSAESFMKDMIRRLLED